MNQFSEEVFHLVKRAAKEQGGVISGDNPAAYNSSDPLRLWVIQVGIIIIFTQVLSIILSRLRQPRVIAEVIGGVILGPSIMGRIPNFTNNIFPSQSIPLLTLTANIGLVFFLFLVGLEIDTSSMKMNAKRAAFISVAGLILPLGLGAALGIPLYSAFIDPDVNKGYFLLFVAVAIGITAFPVLCRILTELRLLDTPVGVVVLSAGVGNDVVGWILLALTVALVNASSGLTALWVLLTGFGFVLFMLFPVKWAFRWLARRTGSLEGGQPSTFMMTITLLMVLVSAFFTDIIGIHAIFGGFLAGLIIPHEGGFAIALVEKLEDFVSLVFLPLYFTLSGLNTNLGLLDNGKTWGYVVFICVIAFFGKFLGCFVTARLSGFNLRESGAIGTLMSCKGLVELIVLNVGLQAGILDTRTFSMFVLHALVLTFMTTPLTLAWYPPSVRTTIGNGVASRIEEGKSKNSGELRDETKSNFAVILTKMEHLPALMTFSQLLQHNASNNGSGSDLSSTDEKTLMKAPQKAPVQLSALRLVELTERTSAVLRSQEASTLIAGDAVLSVARTAGRLNNLHVLPALAVAPSVEFPQRISSFVEESGAQMVVLPWALPASGSGHASVDDHQAITPSGNNLHNPFESMFGSAAANSSVEHLPTPVYYSSFVRKAFSESQTDVALFIDRSGTSGASHGYHLFLPFFGGADDRAALKLVVQLCTNASVRATIVRIKKKSGGGSNLERPNTIDTLVQEKQEARATFNLNNTRGAETQTRLDSETEDSQFWNTYSNRSSISSPSLSFAMSRITFAEHTSGEPLHAALAALPTSIGSNVIAVTGRGLNTSESSHQEELRSILADLATAEILEMARTVGHMGAAILAKTSSDQASSLLVVQAAENTKSTS